MAHGYFPLFRRIRPNARLFLVCWALSAFSYFGIYMVVFNLYLLRLGYGPEFIGAVIGVGSLAAAVVCLPVGVLGRRWGLRRTIAIGMGILLAGLSLLLLVELVPAAWRSSWILFTSTLSSSGAAPLVVAGIPFLMASTGTEERGLVFSLLNAVLVLPGFLGNLVGGTLPGLFSRLLGVSLDDPAPYWASLIVPAIGYLAMLLVFLATREVRIGEPEASRVRGRASPTQLIVIMALFYLLRSGGQGAVLSFFNVYLDASLHQSASLIGLLLAVAQLVAFPMSLVAPLLLARWGTFRSVIVGSIGIIVVLLLFGMIPRWWAAGAGLLCIGVANALFSPAFYIYQMETVSPEWRAVMSGAVWMGFHLGYSLTGFAGGRLIATVGYPRFFLLGTCLPAAAVLLLWLYFLKPRSETGRGAVVRT